VRIALVTDAWAPQVNGTVRTLSTVAGHLRADHGDAVEMIGPDRFATVPAPGYKEIRLAVAPRRRLAALLDVAEPDAVHVATEGPLGWSARAECRRRGWSFTTAFHTRFPDYLRLRTGIPEAWTWAVLRRFHAAGSGTMAATGSLARELATRRFERVLPWTRGVDLERFRGPLEGDPWCGLPRPVWVCVGRVAVEKNLAAFLSLDLPGTKAVVGDGPARPSLQARFPEAVFAGRQDGDQLAASYAAADVFVFPSRTDTFGLVLLEALACGTPVAAFPVPGPLDVLGGAPPGAGALDEDLRAACLRALDAADPGACRRHAGEWSWKACAAQFRAALVSVR
jgi:glycosyltransferase involved in cell wall biosynthesis